MATNSFFNQFNSTIEQSLIDALVVESIKIYGIDLYYLPRTYVNEDTVYGEDRISQFNSALACEMYIKSVDGFSGNGDFLSKFNIQIRDSMTLSVARTSFDTHIGSVINSRPREGDLIFFPLNNKVFEIKFVEHEPIFYQFGKLQMYDLKLELFEYSGELLNTGIALIDNLASSRSMVLESQALKTSSGFYLSTSTGYTLIQSGFDLDTLIGNYGADNDEIELENNAIEDWSESNPFGEL